MKETVYVAVGSNRGDRERIIAQAVRLMGEVLTDLRVSTLYETRPMYVLDQPAFLNAAVEGKTSRQPEELLDRLQSAEAVLGRDRLSEIRMGPRTLDLDILLFGDHVVQTTRLSIPHPRLLERAFALVPLLELAPGAVDPRTGHPLREALALLGDQGVYSYAPPVV